MKFFRYLYILNRKTKGVLLIAVLCLLVVAAIAGGIHRVRSVDGFLEGTLLNGEDISGQPVKGITDSINNQLVNAQVELTEDGKTVLKGSLADFGHDFHEQDFLEDLSAEEERQKHELGTTFLRLVDSVNFELTDYYEDNPEKLTAFVDSSNFLVPRVESEEARIELNEETELYEVIEPVQGNQIDDQKLQEYVDKILDGAIQNGSFLENNVLQISIPENMYTSESVSMDTSALEKEAREKNEQLLIDAFKDVSITYTFGSKTEVLSGDTITDWISVDDDLQIHIDEDKLAEYVSDLAANYETRYRERDFPATDGRTIHFSSDINTYGYTINEDAEIEELRSDILAKESVTREPVYYSANVFGNPIYYGRDGMDDLCGTYIEVSIGKQHLWFYKDYTLMIESDFVSGQINNSETETQYGCYPLAYMASPATLKGENSDGAWETEVDYWMAFNGGQGLHDAPWRSTFGGQIYKTDGSHGCVNLPTDVAGFIYENVTPGIAVIVYQ